MANARDKKGDFFKNLSLKIVVRVFQTVKHQNRQKPKSPNWGVPFVGVYKIATIYGII